MTNRITDKQRRQCQREITYNTARRHNTRKCRRSNPPPSPKEITKKLLYFKHNECYVIDLQ